MLRTWKREDPEREDFSFVRLRAVGILLYMIHAAAFLVSGAMLALTQVRQGVVGKRLEDRIAIDRAIESLNDTALSSKRLASPDLRHDGVREQHLR